MTSDSDRGDEQPPIFNVSDASPEFARFVAGMRRLQDLAVSSAPDDHTWKHASNAVEQLIELLHPHEAEEGVSPAGRAPSLPGAGSLLMPPWIIEAYGPEGVAATVEYSRFYVGTRSAVHGGTIPMMMDLAFGMAIHAAGRPFSRTVRMEIDYLRPVPINQTVHAHGHITRTDGRKTHVAAQLRTGDDILLCQATGLLIASNNRRDAMPDIANQKSVDVSRSDENRP